MIQGSLIAVKNGKDGRPGIDGAPGPQGPSGPVGPVGPAGRDGVDGKDVDPAILTGIQNQIADNTTELQALRGAFIYRGKIELFSNNVSPTALTMRIVEILNRQPRTGDVLVDYDNKEWYYGIEWNDYGQAEIGSASESVEGLIAIASQSEIEAGVNTSKAVTPATLSHQLTTFLQSIQNWVTQLFYTKIEVDNKLVLKADKTDLLIGVVNYSNNITLSSTDVGKKILINSATSVTITVPSDSTSFPIGTQFFIQQIGTGQITIVPASGVSIRSLYNEYKSFGLYAQLALIKDAPNTWSLAGEKIL